MIIEITSEAFGFVIENFYLLISINAIFYTYKLLTYYALLDITNQYNNFRYFCIYLTFERIV